MDIGAQCLEWRDVDHPGLVGQRTLETLAQQLIQGMEKGRERLTRSGWCRDEGMATGPNCVPPEALRGGWLTESLLEPAGDCRMKGGQRHRRNIAAFLDPMRFLSSLRCTHQPAQHSREHHLMNGP
jgi:hypothetical protein